MKLEEFSPSVQARMDYLEKYLKQKELEEKLDAAKEATKAAEERLVKIFEQEGMSSIKVQAPDGTTRTLFIKRQLWAKLNPGFESIDAVAALKAAGLGEEYVKESYNSQSISSFFREREKSGEEAVPDELRGVFQTSEVFSIGVRKS